MTSVQCAAVVSRDIDTCSGVIHLIDKVMTSRHLSIRLYNTFMLNKK